MTVPNRVSARVAVVSAALLGCAYASTHAALADPKSPVTQTSPVASSAPFGAVPEQAAATPNPSAPPPGPATASPESAASPQTSASASPRPLGLSFATRASTTFVSRGTVGPGQVGPEAPAFVAGTSPLAPNTPYDLFSSAPEVPGNVGLAELLETVTERTPRFDLSLTAGLGYVRGSITNASYWGEDLLPTLNPHLGSQALPYQVAFPLHAGAGDDGTGVRLSLLGGAIATADGAARLRVGWFDLAQTNRFVFAQPPLTSVNPAIGYAPAETLTNGVPSLDDWTPASTALPLQGADLVLRRGLASFELADAALPALPGESARLTTGSLVVDHGEGTHYGVQIVDARTAGTPFVTTVPFGADPQYLDSAQGLLPTSELSGQHEAIIGASLAVHLAPALGLDAALDLGRSWYDAAPVVRPGTAKPGDYGRIGIIRSLGRTRAEIDYYRMGPRYATMILPYGVPENQWSVSFAWPGQWLKSNYQLIDNSVVGVNRRGFRLRYAVDGGPLELHAEYADFSQIEPETTQTASETGFVDGFYLPQAPDAATFGRQKRFGFWGAYHPAIGDVTLDVVVDDLYRPFAPGHPGDDVAYEVPQAVVTYAKRIGAVQSSIGLGRYAIKGTFSEPLDIAERLFFAGAELRQSRVASLLVTYRRTTVDGISTAPLAGVSPAFAGSALIVEQRVHF